MQVELLGTKIDPLSMGEAVQKVAEYVRTRTPRFIITMNPEYLYSAQFKPELLELAGQADLVTPDGEGIVWACKAIGRPVPERVTGIDLMIELVKYGAALNWRVFLLGAAPGVAEEAGRRFARQYPGIQIAGTYHGYFKPAEEAGIAEQIARTKPDLLFVALGQPRQELFIQKYKAVMAVPAAMGVGGSLDVIAGKVVRVPSWLRRIRLEWLGRLIKQPSRWRRMTNLPKFAWLVLKKYKLS